MKSKVILDVIVDDDKWVEFVDFDAIKVAQELKDLTFDYVAEGGEHELLNEAKELNVNVCLSNDEEVHRLNKEFRGMDKPTNVLSFANIDDDEFWNNIEEDGEHELGDIILSFETLYQEANEKNISVYAHYCHLLVHGFLHLLGFDHIENDEAEIMEDLEVEILSQFSIDNPYKEGE